MALLSHRVNASSCKVGTSPVGFMRRYSGVSVLPKAPPTSIRSNGRSSSPSPHSTFITLLDVARPQTIRRMNLLPDTGWEERILAGVQRQLASIRQARHITAMHNPPLRLVAFLSVLIAAA